MKHTAAAADRRITRTDLSPDQRQVYESLIDWTRSPNGSRLLTMAGFAGTGKSTLLGLFAAETNLKVAYVCFTGRASSVLGRKLHASGVPTTTRSQTDDERKLSGRWAHLFYSPFDPEAHHAFCSTIHRLIYRPLIDDRTEELIAWIKREILDRDYDLIVIDEASMVDSRILEDIQNHGIRILAVGDHGQLPPVMGDGSLMMNPDLRLEKIHRQAEGSPIIQLSRVLREEGRLARELADGRQLRFLKQVPFSEITLADPLDTALLCWRNQTRIYLNKSVRDHLGFKGEWPRAGEPVIALRNHPPVYNGMRGVLTENAEQLKPWWHLNARIEFPDEEIPPESHVVCRQQFHRKDLFRSIDELKSCGMEVRSMSEGGRLFDFGYALTTHKSQGSQFKHAIVVVDWKKDYNDDYRRRLAYTAITRASERLSIVI